MKMGEKGVVTEKGLIRSRRGKAGEQGHAEPMMLQLPRQIEDTRRLSYREAV
jgi:hypothetical protein